jgi:ABC-type nickel/cobalt efflux system permease component RcnA
MVFWVYFTQETGLEYYSLLILGCFVGMQHALEADHLAAVAAMSAGRTSRRALILRGSLWGLGHTITLVTICGVLLFWGGDISPHLQSLLEIMVAIMIIALGTNVLWRLYRQRPHFHFHQHDSGEHHLHAHTHQSVTKEHVKVRHQHQHTDLGLARAVLVGMMHGTAGSAGLLVLAATASSLISAIGYVIAFGLGSIIGMATLSFVASYPMRSMEECAGWFNNLAFATVGCAAIIVGVRLFTENLATL